MMDLNALIQPGTGYQLTNAIDINGRGEIIANAAPIGFTPDEEDFGHLALLIPCDDDHRGIDACDYLEVDPDAVAASVNVALPDSIRNAGDKDRPASDGMSRFRPQRLVH